MILLRQPGSEITAEDLSFVYDVNFRAIDIYCVNLFL
jgi:hypothetical protein